MTSTSSAHPQDAELDNPAGAATIEPAIRGGQSAFGVGIEREIILHEPLDRHVMFWRPVAVQPGSRRYGWPCVSSSKGTASPSLLHVVRSLRAH
jgi:hypothetical protein